jgi:hypothetical protein
VGFVRVIPKAPRADSRGGFPWRRFSDSIGMGRFAPCHQRSDCERTIRRRSFGRSPVGRRTSTRAGGFCRWRRFGTEWTEEEQPSSAGWAARCCATGCIASTPPGLRASSTLDGGPKPRLSEEQRAQFAQIVEAGPDRAKDGVVRWRRIDLKRVIAERFGVGFSPALCRKASEEARLLPHQRQAAPSGSRRADRRGVQKISRAH